MNDPRGHRMLPYHPDAYDQHFCLRVPLLLWLVMALAVHPEILLLLGHLPQSGNEFAYLAALIDAPALLVSLPAVAVLVAAGRRQPTAGPLVRWLWLHGRWLLLVSLIGNAALCVSALHGLWPALRMASDASATAVLLGVARVRDTLADFPTLPV